MGHQVRSRKIFLVIVRDMAAVRQHFLRIQAPIVVKYLGSADEFNVSVFSLKGIWSQE
jgi:hypothetical protein